VPSTKRSAVKIPKPLIFLDIDGVLNNHSYIGGDVESCVILADNVRVLNKIILGADAEIVLSSAWRYMIPKAMTLKGFEYLLRSHGVAAKDRLIGYTRRDEKIATRGYQIEDWLVKHDYRRYVVIDDGGRDPETGAWCDLGITRACHPVVWVDGAKGLQEYHVDFALGILAAQGS
jgi:hypothetical protein